MDEAAVRDEAPGRPAYRLKRSWPRRLLNELLALLVALALLLGLGLVLLDTAPGHRFIVDRIGEVETATGLKFRIGRIEGSVFGKSRLKNVAVMDPDGVFFTAPSIELDWTPAAWLSNSLSIDRLHAGRATLVRLPKLKPSGRRGPMLPGFDIRIGRLTIDRLEIGRAVTGTPRVGRIAGRADIRSGRALVELAAGVEGADRVALKLDAEPDGDRFDLEARAIAPADGVLPAMLGLKRSMALGVSGQGSWTRWRGSGLLDLAGRRAGQLALSVDKGRFGLAGTLAPSQYLGGKLARLTAPTVRVRGSGTLKDRLLQGRLALGSPALRAVAGGTLDLGGNRYRSVQVGVDLLRPAALFPNMRGRNVRLVWTLDGPFGRADYAYRLTSPQIAFDQTGFVDVRATGKGRLSEWPVRMPLHLRARAITGVGDTAGAILRNAAIDGTLTVTPRAIRGQGLQLRSDKLSGKLSLLVDLVTGRFEVLLAGGLKRYFIDGLGLVDVLTELRVVPGPGGRGSMVTGSGKAWVRRLDNAFFADLAGGLPRIETRLVRSPDGVLHLQGLQLFAPKLRLGGEGRRNRDGTFHIVARGRQADYGPLRMVLDGNIARPRVDLFLDRPNDSLGLTDVRLLLSPTAAGFDYRAAGVSRLGPFTSNGRILMPAGGPTTIAIAALKAGGTTASGNLRADPGGFTGILALAGGGVDGTLAFSPSGGAQRIEAHLAAASARFPGALAVRRGRLDGTILLAEGRTSMAGTVDARGLELSGVSLARLTASANLVNGVGQVRAALAGRRGAAYDFVTVADVAPDRISLTGRGSVDRRALVLEQPAVLTRADGGWALAPTRLRFAGGRAIVSGSSGARPSFQASLQSMPMAVLNIAWPNLDLGGRASGDVAYSWKGGRSGRAKLTIRGLSRAGMLLASRPIDVGLAAVLTGDKAGVRAVAVSGGQTIGRAQARFAPLGAGPVVAALMNAPLFAQLRYQGPADSLWRLSGVEVLDLTGPAAIGADIGGRLVQPVIRGSIRASNARLESAVTGTVIEGLVAEGRFSGPRLVLSRIAGRAGAGTINGSGSVDFTGGGAALDLSFNAANARLLNRDDVAASVTGPLKIVSNGESGTISGKLRLNNGSFTLGRAAKAAAIPRLAVRHRGLGTDEVIEAADLHPWRLAMSLAGGNLKVRGLGIDSIWTTDLDIGGHADAPRFTGRAGLVRGYYEFAGRTFRLDRGLIRFRGESPPDPLLDIHAVADVQGLNASVDVKGTGLKPDIQFASTPALPQDELLSRILFGTSITNLSAPEALQLASAVAALNSGSASLDPINAVRRAVGLDRLRIVPADIATGQKTAVAAGKYLGRKVYVEVITDGHDYSATRVEYQVTRWLSLLSSISTIGRTSANVRVSKDY